MTRTKIVATLGPASRGPQVAAALVNAGVSVFRLNLSHGTAQEHEEALRLVRDAANHTGQAIAVLGDLQGPKIRTGPLQEGQVDLAPGARLIITARPEPGGPERVSTTYEALPEYVHPGQRLLLDDGRIELRVLRVSGDSVECLVVEGGELRPHVGINLPDIQVNVPSLTEKDRADLERCIDWGIDYVALSFVQSPDDAQDLRAVLRRRRARIPVIAKIEKRSAIEQLDGILRVFDGVMVARGDLAVETSLAEVPVFQKRIIGAANALGKPVITATQMLESMTHAASPTRAEASDVANAVWDGTDAVMLSGETAIGERPVLTVEVMAEILQEAEQSIQPRPSAEPRVRSEAAAVVRAACELAASRGAKALVVLTRSGRTARFASQQRPSSPVIAITDLESVRRRLALFWGIESHVVPFAGGTDEMLARTEAALVECGIAGPGDTIVFAGAAPTVSRGRTNFVKVHRVGRAARRG